MEFTDEGRISNAVEVEKRRLAAKVEKRKLVVEELVKKKKLTKEELEQIRDMRMKFVSHISPLEIIEKGDEDFIDDDDDVVVAENVNQIELVIHVIYHYYIYQYWSPPPRTTTSAATATATATNSSSSSSALACQHHDYHHPRDDDDEDMILASCRPLCNPPQKFKIILRQGIFAAAISDDDDDHIALLGDLDVLLEHNVVIRTTELEDLKRGIAHSISEAKAAAHVLIRREKPLPKRVRICCDVSRVAKQYFGSAEAATFVAVEDDAEEASGSHAYFSYIFD